MSRKNIGKYVELTQLGQGGMADVYIGTDPTLNRKVAIKLILPHLASNSDFEVRFQKEAKAIAGMRHRN
ncbi:MAG: serine/threonine protein kinase, partial [Cellvibrionaceae bacterium]